MVVMTVMTGFSISVFAQNDDNNHIKEMDFIKWVDLNASDEIMKKAIEMEIKHHKEGKDFSFISALAYLATKNGNKFDFKADYQRLQKLEEDFEKGTPIEEHYQDNKYFNYYLDAYNAIFANFVGNYIDENGEEQFGVMAFFPLAHGFWFSHYDDFGNSRDYGFKRKHLGHDMYGAVGTPIVAMEGGVVTEMGWNQYGGWRIGIRSHDSKRYYYYAHLRKGEPYPKDLELGDSVKAGEVIGFLGNTGYSRKKDTNLKSGKPHLHLGLQLIFDPSQEKGSKEIWVDVYSIVNLLSKHRAKVEKDTGSNQWVSKNFKIPMPELAPKM